MVTIAGTVFEDVNYGGGPGRDKATAIISGGSGRQNVRVELFDNAGNFVASTLTDVNGDYAFSGLPPNGNYLVRVVNASTSGALDLYASDTLLSSDVAADSASSYVALGAGTYTLKLKRSGSSTTSNSGDRSVLEGTAHTLLAYTTSDTLKTVFLTDNEESPTSGTAKLRVFNASVEAGAVDVYVTTATDSLDTATALASNLQGGAGSGYITINSGTFRVRVTGFNKRGTDLRLDIPAITLDSASVNTLVLTNTPSGSLVTGTLLVQQGNVSYFSNPLTRVRVLNGLAGTPTVSASVADSSTSTTTTILAASRPLNLSSYTTFKAGAGTVTVLVDGSPQTLTSTNFAAGQDYTVLVWGQASNAQVKALKDDNTLPSVNGNVKIRLINGLADPSATATLNVNSQDVQSAINVTTGASSDAFSSASFFNGGNGVPVVVTSPITQSGDPLWVQTGTVTSPGNTLLQANGVYTVVVTGDTANVRGRLYKDR